MKACAIENVRLPSRAVGDNLLVRIVLPPGYDPNASKVYPVLYFLHPWGLHPDYIIRKLRLSEHLAAEIHRQAIPPMVVVLPEGRKSFYLNAADPPGQDWTDVIQQDPAFFRNALSQYGDYGDYLLNEVIPLCQNRYAIRRDRAGQAIGGISQGRAAAAVHAFRDPERFGAVGIHSPALFPGTPERAGPPWIFGLEAESFRVRNPADVARQLAPEGAPRVYLDCGESDPMIDEVRKLNAALEARGIRHSYAVEPGYHNKTYWEPRIPRYLRFYAAEWTSG